MRKTKFLYTSLLTVGLVTNALLTEPAQSVTLINKTTQTVYAIAGVGMAQTMWNKSSPMPGYYHKAAPVPIAPGHQATMDLSGVDSFFQQKLPKDVTTPTWLAVVAYTTDQKHASTVWQKPEVLKSVGTTEAAVKAWAENGTWNIGQD